MKLLLSAFILLILGIYGYSQNYLEDKFMLKLELDSGNVLLMHNSTIQDTVGKFRFPVNMQDYYIDSKTKLKYIMIDDYYTYWLCTATKEKSWNIDYRQFYRVSRNLFRCTSLPKFRFSSTGEIERLNDETNRFEKYKIVIGPSLQEVLDKGGFK